MDFDVQGARAAGYSDADIASFLGQQKGFDTAGALKSGYAPADVIGFLAAPKPQDIGPGPDTSASSDAMRAGDPIAAASDSAAYDTTRNAGGGRGFVNPPALNDETVPQATKRIAANAAGSVVSGTRKLAADVGLLTVPPAKAMDLVAGFITGDPTTSAQDYATRTFVDPNVAAAKYWEPDDVRSAPEKIVNGLVGMAPDLAIAAVTPAGELKAGTAVFEAARDAVAAGMRKMSIPAFNAGIWRASEMVRDGVPVDQAIKSGLTEGLMTDIQGGLAMAAPGANVLTRATQGAMVGATTGEVARQVRNQAADAQHQEPFSLEGLAVQAGTGAALGALPHGETARAPDRVALGYEPAAHVEPASDPIAKVMQAGSVEEATQAAMEIAQPAPPASRPADPDRVRTPTADKLEQIFPTEDTDVSPSPDVPGDPVAAGGAGAGRLDPGAVLGDRVGDVGETAPALEPGSLERAPAADAAPVGDRADAGAVEATAADITTRRNESGTLAVLGEPQAVKALLDAHAIPYVRTADGALVGRSRADDAQRVVQDFQPAADRPEQVAQFKREDPPEAPAPDRVTQIQDAVSQLTRDWLRKPDVHVLDSMADAPTPVLHAWERQNSAGATGEIKGFHWKGGVYLVGDALRSDAEVRQVLYHESLGHFGLQGVFGDHLKGVLDEVAAAMPREMRRKAAQYGADLADPVGRRVAAEEVLAELAETRPEMGLVRRAVAAIRTFLRAHGIDTMKMTRDEVIRSYILPARGYVERGRDPLPSFASKDKQLPEFSREKAQLTRREIQVDGQWRPIEDSEGRPIHPKTDGQRLFWKWAGDTKAVDEQGRPQAVYHGTRQDVSAFDSDKAGSAWDAGKLGRGFYFSEDPRWASNYASGKGRDGSNVIPAYLSLRNPVHLERTGAPVWDRLRTLSREWGIEHDPVLPDSGNTPNPAWSEQFAREAQARGHDGVILESVPGQREFVAFDPKQIKSAIGNRGTFDAENPDVRFSREADDSIGDADPADESYRGPGREMVKGAREAAGAVLDDLIGTVSPLSTGSDRARAAAFDFAAARRKAQWNWARADEVIRKDFTEEQQRKMWEAGHEENELRAAGEDTTGRGLDRLTPEERAVMEWRDRRGNQLLAKARELGMFAGEGVPYWTSRMAVRIGPDGDVSRLETGRAIGGSQGVATKASSLRERKHDTLAESEAALKAKHGDEAQYVRNIRADLVAMQSLERAIAGRELINKIREAGRKGNEELVATGKAGDPEFFTLPDNPAFYSTHPRILRDAAGDPVLDANGKPQMETNQNGDLVFERTPLYMRKEFEGPIRSILQKPNGDVYKALMGIKGAAMSTIMWTPASHLMTEIGRALPVLRTRILPVWFVGNRVKNDPAQMGRAIEQGLVPIGGQHGLADITGIVDGSDAQPGRAWATRQLGNAVGLVSRPAGEAVKKGLDAFGQFWHGTLLWDRIGDLQAGIYSYMKADLMKKGFSEEAAGVQAAHFANRYAGAIKPESVPGMTGKILNVLMFSRSFTLGNLGAMKDCVTGLPKDVQSKILEDARQAKLAMGASKEEATAGASQTLQKARSKSRAVSIEAMAVDIAMMVAVAQLGQMAADKLRGKTQDANEKSFLDRLGALGRRVKENPAGVFNHPLDALMSLSSTSDHEPGREGKVLVGYTKDGTAEYARLALGKIGEEFSGWLSTPMDKAKSKLSTLAKPVLDMVTNDAGFGRPVFNPTVDGVSGGARHIGDAVWHMMKAQVPSDTIQAAWDWARGHADEVDKMKLGYSLFGIPISKGAPGGPQVGEMLSENAKVRAAKAWARPEIQREIKLGNYDEAVQLMLKSGMSSGEIKSTMERALNPQSRLNPKAVRSYMEKASPESRERFSNYKE